jgi:hypothetical protein
MVYSYLPPDARSRTEDRHGCWQTQLACARLAAAVVLTLGVSVAITMLALLASELMARRAIRRLDVE